MKEWKTDTLRGDLKNQSEMAVPSDEDRKARDKGLYYLQFSGKTEEEMRKKLAEQGFPPASVSYAIDFLKQYRYLNDEDYARRYLERNEKKKSEKQLRFELRQKGIDEEIVARVLEDSPVDEESQILKLLEKRRFSGAEATREERQKQAAYLARKGFSYEGIQRAMLKYARKDTEYGQYT